MKSLWKEFRDFAFKGNVLDMAIGIILGGALTTVVKALVDMIMGIISAIVKIPASLNEATATIGTVKITYGAFISALINFIVLAFCVFLMVKAINKAKSKLEKPKEEVAAAPVKSDETVLLEEIRDLLKNQAK